MIIDDSFISKELANDIEQFFLGPAFSWHLIKNTVEYDDTAFKNENTKDYFQFSHVMYANGMPTSDHFQNVMSLFNLFLSKHGIESKALLRVKANLIPQTFTNPESHMPPHIDAPFDHKVFLYYVNDSDGDTIFFDDNKNVVESVSPKKGRAVMFDGTTFHANRFPINSDLRCVINIAFL